MNYEKVLSNKVLCNHLSTYSYTLPSVPLLVERTWEHVTFEPQYEIDAGLGTRYDVEWSRQSSAVLKVTHPQLGSRKLPLLICLALKQKKKEPIIRWCLKFFNMSATRIQVHHLPHIFWWDVLCEKWVYLNHFTEHFHW